jgi:hypothetical protein
VRWGGGQLQRRERRRGKQQKAKFCHDGLGPRGILGRRSAGGLQEVCQQALAINKQALGRIVAAFKRESGFISGNAKSGSTFVHYAFRR